MRTKPNVSIEYHDALYESLDDEAADAMRIARSVLPCSECGSDFGMCGGWNREAVAEIGREWIILLYSCEWDDHELYYPCRQCNPERNIPDDFTPLTAEQVVAWAARECTCPDCKRARGWLDWPEEEEIDVLPGLSYWDDYTPGENL